MTRSTAPAPLSRRTFIVGSAAAAGGGLALGFNAAVRHRIAPRRRAQPPPAPRSMPGSSIKPDDTVRDPHRALGNGPGHAHRPRPARRRGARVRLEEGRRPTRSRPGQNLARKRVWGEMGTGGSRGIRTSQDYVRRGGAAARMMLLQAAADQWKVPVERGHRGRRRDHARGLEAHRPATARSPPRRPSSTPPDPKSIKLKDPKDWKIAGKPLKRLDTAAKLERQPGLRDRRQAAGHAARRDQGMPGVRRQARELRRGEDRGDARRAPRRQGERHGGRGRRRYLVARQDGARRAADRLGRGRRAPRSRARRSPST